jgi:PAS domain S-box-containing protein
MSTILIVDDLADNRKVLVSQLTPHGHRMLEAADGAEALAQVHAERPDLVITDVLMPVMDGYEFVRQMRLDPVTRAIPVVFCTAHYGEREARALALSLGVPDILTKPVASKDVLQIVARVLAPEAPVAPSTPVTLSAAEFDREHLRLLTDHLSTKAEDLRTANARLRAMINIGMELASERDTDRLLQRVCLAARDLFGATYVTLGILDRDDRTVQQIVSNGLDAANWVKRGDSVSGILGAVVGERRTWRGESPDGDLAGLQWPALHPDVQAFLAAPIASPAHVYGWICLVGNEGRAFTADDEQMVLALAGHLGRIYELEHEINERKRAESAARHQHDRAQRYLDAADVILLALDLDGGITQINRKGCAVLGWTEAELLGRDWYTTCLPVRVREPIRDLLSAPIAGAVLGENLVVTRTGEERLIEWRTTELRGDAARAIGTLSSGTDITDRRLLEDSTSSRRRWTQSAGLPAASPTTSTISSPRSWATASCCSTISRRATSGGRTSPRFRKPERGPRRSLASC